MDKTIVATQSIKLTLPDTGFKLVNGDVLKEIVIAYETYGELAPDKHNCIYVCHALTGDAHCAMYHHEDDTDPGWWDNLIGPGKGIDTRNYFVVCSNILGGCKGTTGPGSINPETGAPYGADFPLVSIKDVVRVQKLLLDQLEIPSLHAVIGGSLGGMQALEWSIAYPEYVKRCICIASALNLTPQAVAFDIIGRQEIEDDPDWYNGDYYGKEAQPERGLSRARQIGHITYLSSISMDNKFGRELQTKPGFIRPGKFATNFQVESYLNYQGNKFIKRFDANSYLYISHMMDMFDLIKEHGSIEAVFANVTCRYLIVSISSDWLFNVEQQLQIVTALIAQRKPVSYFQIDSHYGHDAFLLEYEVLGRGVAAFLNSHKPAPLLPSSVNHQDMEHIAGMIDTQAHVLDVGSGSGELFCALIERKKITGICLDLDFNEIVECMSKGLPAIQLDANSGLEIIAPNAFDCILLNQTIQQLRSSLQTILQIVRIASSGVIGFTNFAFYAYRLSLFFKGQLPVSGDLPFEWYNTPNIHLVTVRDFRELCARHAITIEDMEFLSDDLIGRWLLAMGMNNLGCERSLVKISRGN